MLTKSDWSRAAPHAQQLGVTITDAGAVIVDAFTRTSVPGVFAAGDLAQTSDAPQPMFSVANAIATGAMAGAAAVQSLVADRIAALGAPEPAASR
nr:FAD-dependent oxidoreductase [Microbacterium amylolyticum]